MTCQRCGHRPATQSWGGTHDGVSLARNPSLVQAWCERCVVEAQLAAARESAARIPDLERRLLGLLLIPDV